jgi:type II secretory ATPase GspE/PulE/Tfp pilus assembly ATPase PilB-like protein
VGESKVQQIGKPVSYEFNNCFEPEHDNFHIFQSAVKSVILYCLEGINGTIFMYGQTGSGKTFTMLGAKKTEL